MVLDMDKANWQTYRLRDVGTIITGSTPSTKDQENYSSADYCFVKPSDIDNTGITHLKNSEYHISKKAFAHSRQLPKGSILTTCIGIIGKVAILETEASCNQQINAIIPSSGFDSSFIAYAILSKRSLLQEIANAPVVPIINKGAFSSVEIKAPGIIEQRSIATELTVLSNIIEKKNAQLRDLDAMTQSIFYEMFGDPIINERGWAYKRLDEVSTIVGGATPKTQIAEYWSGNNYWVTPAELRGNKYQGPTERTISDEAVRKTNVNLLPIGTVLLSSRAPIGKVAITTVPMYCNQGFKNLVCSEQLCNEYAYQALKCKTEYLNSLGSGATFKEISKKTTEAIRLAVPPIDLQKSFADKSIKIEKHKRMISESLKEAEKLFNSRMDYYFNN